ncbi:2-succinylbenzoate--CoA ligase, chloroplastic/peroxisomal isoform X5 [Benincasa hispida]|uniref:2-succinylbenzoate--CoA ligase, chloroplastic/peroxisomal isoform X5 n=1 Tax=Benincasa hispida TaxID=102211 RepID=UPI00190229CE|nr:2-succinylbenzoate--CoA ligase, chloroplastic/peroxisomal isoform X5 [Benincasa hispida]
MTNYSLPHICQCLTRIATARRASPLTVAGNRRQTGQQFVDSVFALARGLLDLGLLPGHVVVISAFNSDWYLEWLLAVTFVGGIAAPLNYRWSFEEAISAIVSVQPVMLVTDESCCQWYSKLQNDHIPSLRWHVLIGSHLPGYEKTRGALSSEELKKHYVINIPPNFLHAAEGVALICFTSGTTGRPKGVAITHSALIMQALAKVAIVGYSEDDVYLHTAPLCHIGGLSSAIAMLMLGARHILIPKFEVKSAVEAIDLYGVTSLITVPAMMADLVSLIRFFRERDSGKTRESVKKILNGGGGLPLELIKDAVKIFPRAKLVSAYGMTETCSSLTFLMLSDPMGETSIPHFQSYEHSKCHSVYQPEGVCVGKPAPHIEIKICLDGSSHVGRILTRGPHLMLRYYDKISARPSNDVNEVWFDTGDIGSIDDSGNLWLVGRSNGRIKSGGENIYPEEVERILLQHPGVKGCVVVGIPDSRLTEKAVACVQLEEDWQWYETNHELFHVKIKQHLSSEILHKHCKECKLTGFKVPKEFIKWGKPFPVTTMGKLKRDAVRNEVISQFRLLRSTL